MFISIANATTEVGAEIAAQPDTSGDYMLNMWMMTLFIMVLFYVIMIRPQQKRLKEQRTMLDTLKKGDKVVTAGGLYGTVSKVVSDDQVEVDLGGVKVTAARYSLQTRLEDTEEVHKPSNDTTKPKETKSKAPSKKTPAKKTAEKK